MDEMNFNVGTTGASANAETPATAYQAPQTIQYAPRVKKPSNLKNKTLIMVLALVAAGILLFSLIFTTFLRYTEDVWSDDYFTTTAAGNLDYYDDYYDDDYYDDDYFEDYGPDYVLESSEPEFEDVFNFLLQLSAIALLCIYIMFFSHMNSKVFFTVTLGILAFSRFISCTGMAANASSGIPVAGLGTDVSLFIMLGVATAAILGGFAIKPLVIIAGALGIYVEVGYLTTMVSALDSYAIGDKPLNFLAVIQPIGWILFFIVVIMFIVNHADYVKKSTKAQLEHSYQLQINQMQIQMNQMQLQMLQANKAEQAEAAPEEEKTAEVE